ncbi:hypothetical protein CkaCkLH20_04874 [Colletotrichum karsti]|uniref:Uncharacterized protein n=1 Tax=Colletotrichum karsti TaxID=1095194 RepID=A0A9P6LIW8_9PEZI|nr:uncharacterized protein CkaCkLH20_04874 [Colletotrichum karsti]KAF9877739.1 hypothetical protein CkaCkLH20_04874 [Colletotrichum karsti]
MSEKPSRWNNPEFLTSLMMCFYGQLKGDGLSKETKEAIETRLQGEGYADVTWNGIRLAKDNLDKTAKDALVDKIHARGFEDVTWEAIRYPHLLPFFLSCRVFLCVWF